ncbi:MULTISPECIES: carbohydrate ABC transporter permease [Jeotgalibaca]|uniref:Maltodextrin transport system permease protein MalC n=4 Tax=Jeotgalibaca porci TaxID=1868793 RepID=A0A6G7WHF1_9LACT|nr:sugar ABC transporter permease [Jeotgalibaca porci]QIK51649.1 sugar ABC transporter permease [Jeotgalibaca porci]
MKHRRTAAALSFIPGGGQLYNKQWLKALIFFLTTAAFILVFFDLLNMGLWGIVTLGVETPRDNSVFLLAEGILSLIVLAFGIGLYYLNIRDAYANGKRRDNGLPVQNLKDNYHNLINQGYPYLISGPALILLIFSVVFPILFSFALAFTNYDLYHSPPANLFDWVGLQTFKQIFTVNIWRRTFFDVLSWTVVWTLFASTLQITLGVFLAVLVNQKELHFKKLIRTIFVLPWAVPGFVTILVFAGMFNNSFGAINNDILAFFKISPVMWMTDATWTRVALIIIQGWLGFPYIFTVSTGVLQSIPDDLYEAANMDGATALQKFRNITLPVILTAMAPTLITQYTFNFNNFNIIYLFNGGGPAVAGSTAGGTDILVSWIYKLTMQSSQYAIAAALTILLSVFVITIAMWQFRRTNSFKGGE